LAGATMFGIRGVLGDSHPLVTLLVAGAGGVMIYLASIRVFSRSLAAEALDLTRHGLPGLRVLRPARRMAPR
jgi:hypothetical protein